MMTNERQIDMFAAPRVWSPLQLAVFDDVACGTGHTLVHARAGSAKTTTILEALRFVPEGSTIALFAFSKTIEATLRQRAPRRVYVKTLHAHGRKALWDDDGSRLFDGDKITRLATQLLGEEKQGRHPHPILGHFYALQALIKAAKDTLTDPTAEDLDLLVDRFGIDVPPDVLLHPEICRACAARVTDEVLRQTEPCPKTGVHHSFPLTFECAARRDGTFEDKRTQRRMFLDAAAYLMKVSVQRSDLVDYADMCWLPIRLGIQPAQFDRVFVDEAQDLSPSQVELLLRCVKPGGRICVVGDDAQSIFQFRGADEDTIPTLKERLQAKELPLSITYRCARSIVELAQLEVPDFEAAPGAPEGAVLYRDTDELLAEARPGDFIVSRSNAPLIGFYLSLVTEGRRALVLGRKDLLGSLVRLMESFKTDNLEDMLDQLRCWRSDEIKRLKNRRRSTEHVDERCASVIALCRGVRTVGDAIRRARKMFDDDVGPGAEAIILGTTHKLKGLEADRVWMLEWTYRRKQGGEEANCWYVAVTRARTTLVLVNPSDDEVDNG